MENQKQDQKASPSEIPLSATNFYDEDDSNKPQAPATSQRSEQGPRSSSESSEEEEEVHLPDTSPFGKPNTTNYPSLGPQASVPRITPQIEIPGIGSQKTVIPGIGLQAVIPQTMPKQENSPRKAHKHDIDFKAPIAIAVSTSKLLPGIGSSVAATQPEPNAETSPTRTLAGQIPLLSDIAKSAQHACSHDVPFSENLVASNIFRSNDPKTTATPFVTENYKFTLDLPITHQPGHAPAEERFSFTQESKARLGEIDFPLVRRPAEERFSFTQESKARLGEVDFLPARRPAAKPNRFTQPKGPEPSYYISAKASAFTLQDDASIAKVPTIAPQNEEPVPMRTMFPIEPLSADALTATAQAKKRDEEPTFVTTTKSLVEPSTSTHQAKKSAEEPQFKPNLAKPSVLTRQANQPTEFPKALAVNSPIQASYKRPTTKDKGRQEGTADENKKNQAEVAGVRELLTEKIELRSQRDALARDKGGLETKLQSLSDLLKKVEDRKVEMKKAMSSKSKEVADLKTENERLNKEMEALSLVSALKSEQEEVSPPARTEIPENVTVNEDLLAEKEKEIDKLKDTIKQCTEKERDLKASTGMEVLELISKLRKAEDDLVQNKKDEEYVSKRTERDAKKINDLSDELTKVQLSKNRMETELRAQTVKLNKVKTREAEAIGKEVSLEEEVEKSRRSLKESEIEAKSAKELVEKLKEDLEASVDEVKSAKARNDDLAKDLEKSYGRTLTATASADLKKIETLERGQTPPNRPDETNEDDKRKIRDLSADNEALRKELEETKQLASPRSIEAIGSKAATPLTQPEEATSKEENQRFRDLSAGNEVFRKEREGAERFATAKPAEIGDVIKAAKKQIEPLMAQNKALTKTCRDLKKEIATQTDKLRKLKSSNKDLSRKLQESEEAEEQAVGRIEELERTYEDVLPVHATNMELAKQISALRAKLSEETKAKQKSESSAKLLERKIAAQSASLREVAMERAELMSKVSDHEADLAKYADARKSITVEAELEVTQTMMERERARLEEADMKRDDNMKTALDGLEQNERERRQKLAEEVEDKSRLLFEAKKEIRELNAKLEEATETALATTATAASPSSPPSSAQSSPPNSPPTTTTATADTIPWFQFQPFPMIRIQMTLSPRRLLIFLFILSLVFLGPFFHFRSLNRKTTAEREMWRSANEISRRRVVELMGDDRSREAGIASVGEWESEEEGWR